MKFNSKFIISLFSLMILSNSRQAESMTIAKAIGIGFVSAHSFNYYKKSTNKELLFTTFCGSIISTLLIKYRESINNNLPKCFIENKKIESDKSRPKEGLTSEDERAAFLRALASQRTGQGHGVPFEGDFLSDKKKDKEKKETQKENESSSKFSKYLNYAVWSATVLGACYLYNNK